jgi:hypothetical protein
MKHLWLMNGLLLASIVSNFSQELQQMHDISNILSKQDFEEITQFILTNGDRETYSNKYNNNPHYLHEEIHIYLDPISQWINFDRTLSYNINDYNRITIEDRNSFQRFYRILLQDEKVYIYNLFYENELVEKYIPKLKSLIGQNEYELDVDKR